LKGKEELVIPKKTRVTGKRGKSSTKKDIEVQKKKGPRSRNRGVCTSSQNSRVKGERRTNLKELEKVRKKKRRKQGRARSPAEVSKKGGKVSSVTNQRSTSSKQRESMGESRGEKKKAGKNRSRRSS